MAWSVWFRVQNTRMTDPALLYPALDHVLPTLADLGSAAHPLIVPAGTVLFSENAPCQGFPLVLDGEIKVSRSSGDGRSLELYRVVPGELCLVSSACLFRTQPLSAHGITTRASTLLLIPPDMFTRWLETPAFRNEVLGLFAERMADLTGLIDAVAFQRLDQRLAAALLGRGPQSGADASGAGRRTGHGARNHLPAAAPLRARRLGGTGARAHSHPRQRRAARHGRRACPPEPGARQHEGCVTQVTDRARGKASNQAINHFTSRGNSHEIQRRRH